tara:strand:- start:7494 stop:8021 length:528 start_codon:yes stop_codon:yes gene_type:complete
MTISTDKKRNEPRVNTEIKAWRVFVIDEQGNKVGQFQVPDALDFAANKGLDLVEVAPNANPPVCKLMDYGKVKYERSKAQKKNRQNSAESTLKEIRLRPNIDSNDLATKCRQSEKFLRKGHRVKIAMRFKRAEMRNSRLGKEVFHSMIEMLSKVSTVESRPSQSGNVYSVVLQPV